MNKRMREIMTEVDQKQKAAQALLVAKDLDNAQKVLDEVDELKREYALVERAFEGEKEAAAEPAAKAAEKRDDPEEAFKAFGRAAKSGFKASSTPNMSVGSDEDGGYTVPEDVSTRIEQLRCAKASLLDLVGYEKVSTMTGSRTFKKRSDQTGFSVVAEGAAIPQGTTPKFDRYGYTIKKYAGFFALTNELLADSDANVAAQLMQWIADESRVTANKLILTVLTAKKATAGTGIDDIRKAVNVTLGQAFAPTARIVTNDDGLNWLDCLKDANGNPLLKSDPTDALHPRLAIGFRHVPVTVLPNADMPSPSKKLRFIVGDTREGVRYFDRARRSVMASATAAIGDLNAFGNDLTLYRAIEREDVVQRDAEAWVNLEIDPASAAPSTPATPSA